MAIEYRNQYGREGTWAEISADKHVRMRFYASDGDGSALTTGGVFGYYDNNGTASANLHWLFSMDYLFNLQHSVGHNGVKVADYTVGSNPNVKLLTVNNADSPQGMLTWDNSLKQFVFNKTVLGTTLKLSADITFSATASHNITIAANTGATGGSLAITAGNGDTAGNLGLTAGVTPGGVYGDITITGKNIVNQIVGTCEYRIYYADEGATVGPVFNLLRSTGTQAADDYLGILRFSGYNAAGSPEETIYASIKSRVKVVTDGSESGKLVFSVMKAGTLTDSVFVSQAGYLGVGIEEGESLVHIYASNVAASPVSGTLLTLEQAGDTYLQFLSGNTDKQGIEFGDTDNNDVAEIAYYHLADLMFFSVDATSKMAIGSDGVGIGDEFNPSVAPGYLLHLKETDADVMIHNSDGTGGKPLVSLLQQGDEDGKIFYIGGYSGDQKTLIKNGDTAMLPNPDYFMCYTYDFASRITNAIGYIPIYRKST